MRVSNTKGWGGRDTARERKMLPPLSYSFLFFPNPKPRAIIGLAGARLRYFPITACRPPALLSFSLALSLLVHVHGLGSGIRDRCKPEIEIQSNSAAITGEKGSRLGSRLSAPRLPLQPELDSIGPYFDWRRFSRIGKESWDIRRNRCADVCEDKVLVRAVIAFERESRTAEGPDTNGEHYLL